MCEEALKADLAEALYALRPFVMAGKTADPKLPDGTMVTAYFVIADFRKAAEVMEKHVPGFVYEDVSEVKPLTAPI